MMKYLFSVCFCILSYCGSVVAQDKAYEIQTVFQEILNNEHGGHHFFESPAVCQVKIEKDVLLVFLEFGYKSDVKPDTYDHLLESFAPALFEYKLTSIDFKAKLRGQNKYINLSNWFPSQPIVKPKKSSNSDPFPDKKKANRSLNPMNGQGQRSGSLSGKIVWLSPGHGWLNDDADNQWLTQRGNTHDYVEDFGTVEGVNYFLQQYLHNAGAEVWSVRERDLNSNEIIVDNDDSSPAYQETGFWNTSGSSGYNGQTYRFAASLTAEDATAIYTPDIPKSSWYWVSVQYRSGANRVTDTKYTIHHAGGSTDVFVNQEIHDFVWVYLGRFYFEKGQESSVILSNQSNEPGQAIISDVVRFGGGIGDVGDCSFGGPGSGKPRYEEGARQYAIFQGYPTCESDVTIRPRFAEYQLAEGALNDDANAVYLSWHTNAFNASARGTETYSYNGAGSNPAISPGSNDLRNFIHEELINDIQDAYDPTWQDRGVKSGNFGELRELYTIPGCLLELAFHDEINDAEALKSPQFRNLAARAMYKGILQFFHDRDGISDAILPETPTHIKAQNVADGEIRLEWNSPIFGGVNGDQATQYKVYFGTHGLGFNDGIVVSDTSHTFVNLQSNTTYYFKVAALNTGGESFPSSTVAARTPRAGFSVPYLIVDGFDRLDRFGAVNQFESPNLGNVDRMFLDRMNDYSYMVDHARGLSSCDIAFDGCVNDNIENGSMDLKSYQGVDWITGEESTVDLSLNPIEQDKIASYLDQGGNLIISGAEIGWDIGRTTSNNASTVFYNNYLKSMYSGDDSNTYSFNGIAGTVFNGLTGDFDDGTQGRYNVEYPDRISPTSGSVLGVNYSGGTADGAAIMYKGSDFGVVNFGFPIESIVDDQTRNDVLCQSIAFLTPDLPCPDSLQIMVDYNSNENLLIEARQTIHIANTNVNNMADIIYSAGDTICLDTGFMIQSGASLEVNIGGCDP